MLTKRGSNRWCPRAQYTENSFAPGGVETVADLEALNDLALDDGTIVVVLSLNDGFQLDKDSTLVSDHITVADTLSGTGRWLRERWPSLRWRLQDTWYIDAAGDDENSGLTALLPLETHEELMRRWGDVPLTISPTVNVASDLTGDLIVRAVTEPGQVITYVGERTALYSGTLSAVTPYSAATSTLGTVTDAALPVSWTASGLVDGCLRMTAGASSGARGWITYDAGAKVARFSPLLLAGAVVAPTTDTFEVVELTQIAGNVVIEQPATVTFTDLRLTDVLAGSSSLRVQSGYATFTTCDIEMSGGIRVEDEAEGASFQGCRLWSPSGVVADQGRLDIGACYLDECQPVAINRGYVQIDLATLGQGPGDVPLTAQNNSMCEVASSQWYVVADQTAATGGAVRCLRGCRVALWGTVWGVSNVVGTTGVYVEPGGLVFYGFLRDVLSATNQVLIDSVPYAIAEMPVFDASVAAGVIEGQNAILAIGEAILWLQADVGVTITGSGVSEWLDQSGHDNHATQTVDADRPAYLPAGGVNGLPGVEFDSANSEWMTLGTITEASNDWTVIAVVSQGALAGTQYLLATADDALVAAGMRMGASSWVGGDDGTADRDGMPPLLGEQYLEWHWDSGAGTLSCYRDGVLLGSDSFDSTLSFSLSATLGALASGTGPFNGVVSELIVFRRILSSAELAAVRSYIESRYALAFSPASVADLLYWLRTDDAASITTVAASELLTNGNCDSLVGWSQSHSVASVEASGLGDNCIKVLASNAIGWRTAQVYQPDKLVAGKEYLFSGFAQSDGIQVPLISDTTTKWTGVNTHTDWQPFSFYAVATGTFFSCRFLVNNPAGTEFCRFNNVSVKLSTDANVSEWSDTYGSRSVVQATESKRPLYLPTGWNGQPCISFDGVNELLQGSGAGWADAVQPYTIIFVCVPSRGNRISIIQYDGANPAGSEHARLALAATGRFGAYAGVTLTTAIAIDSTARHVVATVFNDVFSQIIINGVTFASGGVGPRNPLGLTIAALKNGTFSGDQDITDAVGIAGVPTTESLAALYQYFKGLRGTS